MTTENKQLDEQNPPEPEKGQSGNTINAPDSQIGVLGDHAKVEGGIHFNSTTDQRGQTVQGDQYNAGRDVTINQAPEPSPGPPNTRFWQIAVSVGIIITIIAGVVAIFSDSLNVISYLATTTPTPTPTHTPTITPTPSPSPTPLAFAPEQSGETLIVVSAFHVPEGVTNTEPHTKIRRAIEEKAKEVGLDALRVEEEPTILEADQRAEAEALGKAYDASMVIWGEDTGVQVIVNFLNLKQPYFEAAAVKIEETERVQLANPETYTKFIVQDLPGQLTFLSLFAVGQFYYITENYQQALDTIEAAIGALNSGAKPEGLADACFRVGWLYSEPLPDYEKAIQYYDQAIALDPDYSGAYNNRGNVYSARDNLDQAIADFTQAIALDPDYPEAYNNRAIAYFKQTAYEKAITDYTRALDLDPDYAGAYSNRGTVYFVQGKLEQAIADFTHAIEINPDDAVEYNKRGLAYAAQNNYEQAIADYNRAIDLNPDYAAPYNSRGLAYYAQGNYEQAIADYNRAIDLNPDYAATYNSRGLAYYNQGDYEQTIADFTKALDLAPDNTFAYVIRGLAYYNQGDLEQAIANYNRAIDLDPHYVAAYNNRGIAYFAQGDLEQAIADYTRAIDFDPEDALAYNNRGFAYKNQGKNLTAAIADYEKYLELAPNADDRDQINQLIQELKSRPTQEAPK